MIKIKKLRTRDPILTIESLIARIIDTLPDAKVMIRQGTDTIFEDNKLTKIIRYKLHIEKYDIYTKGWSKTYKSLAELEIEVENVIKQYLKSKRNGNGNIKY